MSNTSEYSRKKIQMALGKINFYPLKKQWSHETTFLDRLAEDGLGDKKGGPQWSQGGMMV